MKAIIGIVSRLLFWLTAVFIVGLAALNLFTEGNVVYAVLALVFFPLTYFYYPFVSGLWWLLLISIVFYGISTIIGGMKSVD